MRSNPNSGSNPQRGTAMVELALLAPLLILLGLGVADFGRVMYASMAVDNAARAGVQHALDYRYTDSAGIQAAAVADAGTSLSGFTTNNVTVTTSCLCPGNPAIPPGPPCQSLLGKCAAGKQPKEYVSVTTTYTFKTIAKYPGIPNSVALTGNATVRVQ